MILHQNAIISDIIISVGVLGLSVDGSVSIPEVATIPKRDVTNGQVDTTSQQPDPMRCHHGRDALFCELCVAELIVKRLDSESGSCWRKSNAHS